MTDKEIVSLKDYVAYLAERLRVKGRSCKTSSAERVAAYRKYRAEQR